MDKTLRVLHVEDSARDAALVTRHLSRAGYELTSDRVDTPEAMRAALESQEWDVILCDYSMPHFNALSALALLKEMHLEIPFIIISGTIGEEVAVEAMRAGANDYLMKRGLARLQPTIERELHEADNRRARRQAEAELRHSEAQYRRLIDTAYEGIWIADARAHITYANQRLAEMLGYTVEEMIGRSAFEVMDDDTRAEMKVNWQRRLQGIEEQYDLRLRRKDGSAICVILSATPIRDESGQVTGVLAMLTDITKRKRAEQLVRLQATALESADNAILISGPDGAIIWVNKAFTALTGYAPEEVLGQYPPILRADQQDPAIYESMWKTLLSGQVWHGEITNLRKDGSAYVEENTITPVLNDAGEITNFIAIKQDITARKQTEEKIEQSKIQLSEAQRLAHIGSWNWDLLSNTLIWSDEHYRILGLRPGEIDPSYERVVAKYIHPEDRDLVKSGVENSLRTLEPFSFHYRSVPSHGDVRIIHARGKVVADPLGKPIRMFGTAQDVTEFKRAEEEQMRLNLQLENQRQRLNNIVASVPGVVWETWVEPDAATQRINFISDYVETMLGYSVEEWLSTPNFWLSIVHPDDREQAARDAAADFAGGESSKTREFRWVCKDGRVLWVQASSAVITDDAGRVVGLRGVNIDVTERKRAEEALRESEERHRLLFASNPLPLWVYDLETLSFLEVNAAAVHRYGYSREEFLSMTIKDIHPPEDVPAAEFSGGLDEAGIWKHRKKDGEIIDVEITSHELIFAGRRAELVLPYDVTERTRSEETRTRRVTHIALRADVSAALAMSDTALPRILERCTEAMVQHLGATFARIWTLNKDENVLELQASAGLYTNIDGPHARVPVGALKIGLIAEERLPHITNEVLTDPRVNDKEWAEREGMIAFAGYPLIVEDRLVGVMAMFARQRLAEDTLDALASIADIISQGIERKRAEEALRSSEEQLRQSQKLEAIGMLAGGVAHDFNNLLTVITGYCDLTLLRLREEDPLRSNISEVKKASGRAAGLTRQLLAFSRKQILQPRVLDLNAVVTELKKMLGRLIGEDIELRTVFDSELGSVNADPGQIEQIVMNLAVNARDAMQQGGKLTIETKNVYLDEEYAKNHIAVIPGPYVMLTVSDSGTGIDQETQARMFEPFFTTKELGKGSGLGLSTVYGIVKQSGGNIWVYSEVGHGTTFKIYLPRVDEGAEEYKRTTETEVGTEGAETILLAEDEEMVRRLARQVLETYGYQVLEAANGGAALLICERHAEPIHLLITDVIMPEMSGRQLADRLAHIRPQMKVLYMSGYTDNSIVHRGALDEGANFIQKPFTTNDLARKVREVLDEDR